MTNKSDKLAFFGQLQLLLMWCTGMPAAAAVATVHFLISWPKHRKGWKEIYKEGTFKSLEVELAVGWALIFGLIACIVLLM